MSTNSCISDTDSLIAVRFPRQSFTAAHLSVPLGAEFTFVFPLPEDHCTAQPYVQKNTPDFMERTL